MSKVILDNINSGYNLGKINANFEKIEQELNGKVLYRDSTLTPDEPNQMEQELDMNSYRILNSPDPIFPLDVIRLKDLEAISFGGEIIVGPKEEVQVLVDGQVDITLTKVTTLYTTFYLSGGDTDRGRLTETVDYNTTSANSITLVRSHKAGTKIIAVQNEITSGAIGEVASIFGRTGIVLPVAGDYEALEVDYDNSSSGLVATNVGSAIDELDGDIANNEDNITSLEALTTWEAPKVANFTAEAKKSYQIDASTTTVDITLPVLGIGDPFIFHNLMSSTNKVQILNPIEEVVGSGGSVVAGTNIELVPGQSVQLVAKSVTVLSIVGVL